MQETFFLQREECVLQIPIIVPYCFTNIFFIKKTAKIPKISITPHIMENADSGSYPASQITTPFMPKDFVLSSLQMILIC